MNRLRVLFLIARPEISGPLPKLAPLMVDEMRRLGCVVVTAPWSHSRSGETPLQKAVERARDILNVRRILKAHEFDVVLVTTTHDWPALCRDLPLLRLTRGLCHARILHLHGSMADTLVAPGHYAMKACTKLVARECDAILVLSQQERSQWLSFSPATRVEVVVNPFVPPTAVQLRRAPDSGRTPVLLFVGRLIREKGVFDLLEALRIVHRERPCVLHIAGKGPEEDAVRRRVMDLGLSDSVSLLGYVGGEVLWDQYSRSSALVLPTYFGEGFPTVITEAMSAGLPVITTPIRGSADLLSEGSNALFVPPRRPDALARAVLRLLSDPALAADMGRHNKDKVLAFAPEVVVPHYVEIMRSLTDG